MQQKTTRSWTFPSCPTPAAWHVDWEGIERQFSWIRALAGVQQDPFYHAEGDVLVHTRMVATELVQLDAWRALPPQARMQVFAAALLHDVAKPECTPLDEIRKRLHISPEGNQGLVIQTAKEQARAYMRQQQPFVWNATNVTRALREQLVNFFVSYGARVRIVYLDAPLETIFRRNRSRAARVPDAVMNSSISWTCRT